MAVDLSKKANMAKAKKWLYQQIERVIKYCPDLIKKFTVDENSPCCLSCNTVLDQEMAGFCSAKCYLDNLHQFRNQYSKDNGGKFICSLESCDKPCYVENNGHVHDYCGQGHAKDHRRRIESVWPGTYGQHHHHHPHHQVVTHHYNLRSHSGHSNSGCGPIFFYDRNDPYYEFTNFAYYPIVINGIRFPTSEHYFQSQKLIGTPFLHKVCELPRPRQAFEYPRQPHVSVWVRQDWQSIKDDVMYIALIAKFTQHPGLKKLLLETGDRMLVEHSPYDSYWGDGGDGKGLNRLGELLMKLRATFRGEGKKLGWREEQDRHRATAQSSPNQYTNPTSGDQYTNPTSGDQYTNPTSGDQYTNPTGGKQYTKPTSGDQYKNPTGADRYTDNTGGDPDLSRVSDFKPNLITNQATPCSNQTDHDQSVIPELPSVEHLSRTNTDPQPCLMSSTSLQSQDTTSSSSKPITPCTARDPENSSTDEEEPMDIN